MDEKPYLEVAVVKRLFNPAYDPDNKKNCLCGHRYERHFDTYDYDINDPNCVVGCKYCGCNDFVCAAV
jgi:hypothetical protein